LKILYLSLFPETNSCNEIANLEYFRNSAEYYGISDLFSYRLFSNHDCMVNTLRTVFDCEDYKQEKLFDFEKYPIQVERLFFDTVYRDTMNEKRAHEIAWSKQRIFAYTTFKHVLDRFDYIFYNDADIKIDAKDIHELCKVLEVRNFDETIYPSFINIPYVIKLKKQIVSDSFGSFIIPTKVIEDVAHVEKSLYEIYEQDGKFYRKNAPDWILRQQLIREGYKEIRGESCNTKHYINDNKYYEFDAGKLTFN